MERIKDLSKLIIQDDMVLVKIKEKPAPLIARPDTVQKGPEIEYSTIVLKGKHEKCNRFNVGDIILQMSSMTLEVHEYKGESYALVPEFTIKLVVSPDNFDEYYVRSIKSSLTIN